MTMELILHQWELIKSLTTGTLETQRLLYSQTMVRKALFILLLESKNVLVSCDFIPNGTQVIATSLLGEISIFCLNRQKRTFYHDTLVDLFKADQLNKLPPEV
jgi:hypothetical protein